MSGAPRRVPSHASIDDGGRSVTFDSAGSDDRNLLSQKNQRKQRQSNSCSNSKKKKKTNDGAPIRVVHVPVSSRCLSPAISTGGQNNNGTTPGGEDEERGGYFGMPSEIATTTDDAYSLAGVADIMEEIVVVHFRVHGLRADGSVDEERVSCVRDVFSKDKKFGVDIFSTKNDLGATRPLRYATSKEPYMKLETRPLLQLACVQAALERCPWLPNAFAGSITALNAIQAIVGVAAPNWLGLLNFQNACLVGMTLAFSVYILLFCSRAALWRLLFVGDVWYQVAYSTTAQVGLVIVDPQTMTANIVATAAFTALNLFVLSLDAALSVNRHVKAVSILLSALFNAESVLYLFFFATGASLEFELIGFFTLHWITIVSTCLSVVACLQAQYVWRLWGLKYDAFLLRFPCLTVSAKDFRRVFAHAQAAGTPGSVQHLELPTGRENDEDDGAVGNDGDGSAKSTGTRAEAADVVVVIPLPHSEDQQHHGEDERKKEESRYALSMACDVRSLISDSLADEVVGDVQYSVLVRNPRKARHGGVARAHEEEEPLSREFNSPRRTKDNNDGNKLKHGGRSAETVWETATWSVPPHHPPQQRPRAVKEVAYLHPIRRHVLLSDRPIVSIPLFDTLLRSRSSVIAIFAFFALCVVLLLLGDNFSFPVPVRVATRLVLGFFIAACCAQIKRDFLWWVVATLDFWFALSQVFCVIGINVAQYIECHEHIAIVASHCFTGFFLGIACAGIDAFAVNRMTRGVVVLLFALYNFVFLFLTQLQINKNDCGMQTTFQVTGEFFVHLSTVLLNSMMTLVYLQIKFAHRLLWQKRSFAMLTFGAGPLERNPVHVASVSGVALPQGVVVVANGNNNSLHSTSHHDDDDYHESWQPISSIEGSSVGSTRHDAKHRGGEKVEWSPLLGNGHNNGNHAATSPPKQRPTV